LTSTLPVEVEQVDTFAFNVAKCNPIGTDSVNDPQCNDGTVPYQKNFNLILRITLLDGSESSGTPTKSDVPFTAQILNACLVDTVSFTSGTSNLIPYKILDTPVPQYYTPTITQDYALCPMSCSYTGDAGFAAFITQFELLQSRPSTSENDSILLQKT